MKTLTHLFCVCALAWLWVHACPVGLYAQHQSYRSLTFDSETGLPSDLIKAVVQDDLGFVWVATDDGLARYDGLNFQSFYKLPSLYVKYLMRRKNGQVLAVTDLGIVHIESHPDTVILHEMIKGSMVFHDAALWYPKSVFEDRDGALWISESENLVRYHQGKVERIYFDQKNRSYDYIRSFSVFQDEWGRVWAVSLPGHLYAYDMIENIFREVKLPIDSGTIFHACYVGQGKVWLAGKSGVYQLLLTPEGTVAESKLLIPSVDASYITQLNKQTFLVGTWSSGIYRILIHEGGQHTVSRVEEFTADKVHHLFADRDQNIWVSTEIGLIMLQPTMFKPFAKELLQTFVHDIRQGTDGSIYFCEGRKVMRYDEEKGELHTLYQPTTGQVIQAAPAADGIWISNTMAQLVFVPSDGSAHRVVDLSAYGFSIFNILIDQPSNDLWVCQDNSAGLIRVSTNGLRIRFYREKEGVPHKIRALCQEPSGDLYVGGEGDSTFLFRYDRRKDIFVNVSPKLPFEADKSLVVNDLECGPHHTLWIGTTQGLLRYRQNTLIRQPLGTFTEESVKAIALDDQERLWLGIKRGLLRYADGLPVLINEAGGLPSRTINYRGLYADRSGKIWAGTAHGVGVMQMAHQVRKTPTPLLIALKVNDAPVRKEQFGRQGIVEGATLNALLATLSFPGNNILYQSRLSGWQEEWTSPRRHYELQYSSLPAGKYTLQVRAIQQGGYEWSDPVTITFEVHRVWYNTWWAYSLYALICLTAITISARAYSRKLIRDRQKLRANLQLSREELLAKNQALEQTNRQLRELDEEKNHLIGIVAHDLRSPLNQVMGYLQILRLISDNHTDEQRQFVDQIGQAIDRLRGMISKILDLNAIENQKANLTLEPVEISQLAQQVVTALRPAAEAKGILLHLQAVEGLPYARVDRNFTTQILENLLSNAIKFSPTHKHVRVEVKSVQTPEMIRISVSDEGPGIQPEDLPKLFGKFQRLSAKPTAGESSTGLGLSIVKRFAEAMQGRVGCESSPGQGATFWVQLPVQP